MQRNRRIQLPIPVLSFLLLSPLLLIGTLAAQEGTEPPRKVLRLTLNGQVFEGQPPLELFGDLGGHSLRDLIVTIRQAAQDRSVAALVLRLKNPIMDWVQVETLRRELIRFRQSGKPSYCHLSSAGTSNYLLASACSDLSLHPTGLVEIPGINAQLLYMRGLFAKLGIEFQELRVGRYKSAAEPLTREQPSEPVREELHSILDQYYNALIQSIAENRSLEPTQARALIDQRLFKSSEAKQAGLVDRIEYEDAFYTRVRQEEEKELELVDAKLTRQLDFDLSGFTGVMKLFSELLGGGSRRSLSTKPKLALIIGGGAIVESVGPAGFFATEAISSDEMAKVFRQVRQDDSIKAVVFRINSPGGSALASDLIWRQVEITKETKPVVVSMGNMAASGGYYISCGATWIFADKSTLTGSIGVIGAVPSVRELFDKIGLRVSTFSRGRRANVISGYGELTEDGRDLFMKYVRSVYDDFIGHVAEGRGLSKEAVASLAEGRVWTGEQALKHGLVDAIGGLEEAVEYARTLAKLEADSDILILPKQKTFLELLSGEVRAPRFGLDLLPRILPSEARPWLQYAERLATLQKEKVLAIVPELILIR